MPGSVTSSARDMPSRSASQPASETAPGPNLIGVASRVKTVSNNQRTVTVVRALTRLPACTSEAVTV
jgi:hypothetical protein